MKMKFTVFGITFAMLSAVSADVPLDGVWHVTGDGFAGEARLPGTLAASKLGKRWTKDDFRKTMNFAQSEALAQEWQ